MMPDIIHVAVAVIVNEDGEVCISLRQKESHQGGLWEFPGGKIESDETVEQALSREIKEELNLEIITSRPLITIPHDYDDKKVCLHVRKVVSYQGKAIGLEGQEMKWLPVDRLSSYTFPAANHAIIRAIQLPDRYLITGKFSDEDDFLKKLTSALDKNIRLVQLRLKEGDIAIEKVPSLVQHAASLCGQSDVRLLLNLPNDFLSMIDMTANHIDGIHADSKSLKQLIQRPDGQLFSASCHNEDELLKAKGLNADFVVLSPVQKTASHPEMDAMGWQKFSSILQSCTMPVYALGGVSETDIDKAWLHGAQGIAAISALWH